MAAGKTKPKGKAQSPARVTFLEGGGDLPMIEIATPWSTAEVYLHGAHVTHFQKHNEPPLLFLSHVSRFEAGHPIRGGIPIIFPWFGPREGMPAHGFARLKSWDLKEIEPAADGSVKLRFRLPDCVEASSFPPFTVEYTVNVGATLALELVVTNTARDQELVLENCLHTYFNVGEIGAVEITGLKGCLYLDRVGDTGQKVETAGAIQIQSEVDRAYLNTTAAVEIADHKLRRKIRIEKSGSDSTVVWNPWIAKSQQMPDFGNEEYQQMVCVESGNVAGNKVVLHAGQTATLGVSLSSTPI